MTYLIFALIFLGIYLLTYRNIGKTINEAISEDSPIFNRNSTLFYRLLTLSPLIALYEALMRMGQLIFIDDGKRNDWPTIEPAISICGILALWVWYYIDTNKLKSALYWGIADPEEYLPSLQKKVKQYFIFNLLVIVLVSIWNVLATLMNFGDSLLYSCLTIALLLVINIYLLRTYHEQKSLLCIGSDKKDVAWNPEPEPEPKLKSEAETAPVQKIEATKKKPTKRCPYCGEEILAVAKKCKHCGEWLDGQTH